MADIPEIHRWRSWFALTWPDQKILRGTIDTIADVIHAEGVVRQAMIVVGRVLDTDYELSKLYDSSFTTMFRQGTDIKMRYAIISVSAEGRG